MVSVSGVAVGFSGDYLFEDVTFMVGVNDKIGLAGRNGAGKSTLMKVMSGQRKPDLGAIAIPNAVRIGYLAQDLNPNSALTVIQETKTAFAELNKMAAESARLQEELNVRTDYETEGYMNLAMRMADLETRYGMMGGYDSDEKTIKVLKGLGFSDADMDRPLSEFSGGWQMRVELAKLLLTEPDLVLLDEPTNHLDIESIVWLEKFLSEYPKAVMLVSHDKTFLDKVTNRTIEITGGTIQDYKANYTKYLELRAERRAQQSSAKKNQDKQIAQMERNIDRFRAKASKASMAQSLIKKLDKIDRIEVDDEDTTAMRFRFPEAPHSGKVVITADRVSKKYGDKLVIPELSFTVNRGDRIAFVGRNGMGKTTLAKMMAGDIPYEGKIEFGYNVLMGYFAQHQAKELEGNKTVLEEMEKATSHSDLFTRVRSLLGAFLFSGDDVYKKVKVLSGGERGRLALAKLLTEPLNFLLLDEPTNHLDLRSKEVLKQALNDFKGTLIVVSHDRDFLNGLTDKIFEFTPEGIKEHLGGIDDFLARKEAADFRAIEGEKTKRAEQKEVFANQLHKAETASPAEKRRGDDKEAKKLKNRIAKSEETISELEKKLAEMDARLQDPESYRQCMNDSVFFQEYNNVKADLEKEMELWEKMNGEFDDLVI
jgi:ATP-binding cassette subfamily F protein 3